MPFLTSAVQLVAENPWEMAPFFKSRDPGVVLIQARSMINLGAPNVYVVEGLGWSGYILVYPDWIKRISVVAQLHSAE